jgi:hypothetical protein
VVRWEVGDWPIAVPTALEPVTKGLNSNAAGSRYRCPDCAILEVGSSCHRPRIRNAQNYAPDFSIISTS